jgi:hypothetical protein
MVHLLLLKFRTTREELGLVLFALLELSDDTRRELTEIGDALHAQCVDRATIVSSSLA